MDARIDYLSFTIMTDLRDGAGQVDPAQVGEVIGSAHLPVMRLMAKAAPWSEGGARGHYKQSSRSASSYMTAWYGGTANHILVELPGTACQLARDHGLLDAIVTSVQERVTRVDIAVDIPDACTPAEFVQAGYNERFQAHASIVSPEGSTEYIGSMKSERFARVYRYAPPHPRAGLLRVEHVFRSDYGKAVARRLGDTLVETVAAECGNTFGWTSPYWIPGDITDAKIRSSRADRHEPGRVRWLHGVCIPSLVKAHREGLIDVRNVIETLERLCLTA
jgi:hypothetical protein